MPNRATAVHNLGDLLLREGLINGVQLDAALARQRETDQPLMRILVETGTIDETKRLNFFKRQFGVPMVTLQSAEIDPILYTYIPAHTARKHRLVPVKLDRDGLVVAMEDPSDVVLLDNLKDVAGLRIKPVIAASEEIAAALENYPEPKVEEAPVSLASEFDFAVRFFSYLFLPIMSALMLVGIFLLVVFNADFQGWLREHLQSSSGHGSQYFTLFLYFFLSWGVWTILMYEVRGLVFDDLEWKAIDEVGEEKLRSKAVMLSICLGFLGIDRFYLGYRRMFFLKLFTLGLAGIWWVLDAVLMLGGKIPDAAGRKLV